MRRSRLAPSPAAGSETLPQALALPLPRACRAEQTRQLRACKFASTQCLIVPRNFYAGAFALSNSV